MTNTFADNVISLLQSHRSIRKFTSESIPDDTLASIIQSAQMAATSSHIQAYTIIDVQDNEKRVKLAEYAGHQQYVVDSARFLVFCADLHRVDVLLKQEGTDVSDTLNTTEKFIVATVDAALAAQNAAVAAESLGLGICYIGGIRNNPESVSQILQLAERVYPVFGMCIGYPAQDPEVKPRLPLQNVLVKDVYPSDDQIRESLQQYDQDVATYYASRTDGKRDSTWTDSMRQLLQNPTRTHMKQFLTERGFPLV